MAALAVCALVAHSEPNPTALNTVVREDGIELRFTSEPNFRYTIEYRDGLGNDTPWQEKEAFRDVDGTGETLSYLDTETANGGTLLRYYRVRIDSAVETLLALYEFTNEDPAPQVVHTNLAATVFGTSSGSLNSGYAQESTWTGSGVPYAQGNSGWSATNAADAKYFSYTLMAVNGQFFAITNIRFLVRATTEGPSASGIFINDTLVHQLDVPDNETFLVNVPISGYNNLTQAVIRIPGWNNDSRDTAGTGHFRIDDVRTEGTVTAADELESPSVTDPSVLNISDTSATLGGTVSDTGGATVTERGVYWSTSATFTPPEEGAAVSETGEFGTGAFTLDVDGFTPETVIYFRAFASNTAGVAFSEQASFVTADKPALAIPVITDPISLDVTENTAKLGGTVVDDGGGVLIERGIYWSMSPDFVPPEEGQKIYQSGEFDPEAFTVSVAGLPRDTEIYFRAFVANAEQIGFTELTSFVTLADNELAFYGFSGYTAEPESHRDSIIPTDLAISAGSFSFDWSASDAPAWESFGAAEPYITASGGGYWSATVQSDARYYGFTLTAESGWVMTITGVTFVAQASRQGPSAVGVGINGANLHEENMPDETIIRVIAPVTGYTDISAAEIRVQGWLNGSRSSTGRGAFRVDNIQVHGFMSMDPNVGEPVVTTPTISGVQSSSATLGGTIEADGGATINERGIYWSTVADFPLGGGTKVSQTGTFGVGAFTVTASQLPAETVIYFRAFARSAAGTGYSDQLSFTTASLEAALLSLYEFTDGEITPHARHPNVTSSHLIHDSGRPGIGSVNESLWTGSGVPYAQVAGGLAATDVSNARHFIYAIEARTGTTFDITNITFLARATAAGPSALSVSIDGNVIHTQNMPNGSVVPVQVPVSGVTGRALSRVRILGWDNGSRDTSGTGLLQIDDVRTEGAVSGSVTQPVTEGRFVRVASYNTENGIGEVDGDKYNALKATLARLDADIVAFQELFANQSNEWVALATELGYDHTALAPEGGQRTGYFSRFPIQSTQAVGSPAPANEMARPVWRAVIDVPDADQPLVIWNAHKKAMGDEVSQFRRAVETIRIIQDIDAYRAANTAHVEYIVLGDMNADFFTQPQSISFSEAWYNDNESAFPANYELGEDISFPVLYARFPDDRYTEANHGFYRSIITQSDGNGIYSFLDNNFISRLDYLYVSDALATRTPAGEIYHSELDGTFAGLPKAGDPLAAETSWTASDHLAIFIDLYMSNEGAMGGSIATETAYSTDSTTDDEGDTSTTLTLAMDGDAEDDADADMRPARDGMILQEVAEFTRVEILPLADGHVAIRFPSNVDFLYTIESTDAFDGLSAWVVVNEYERIPGTGEPISRVDDRPMSNGVVRFYRVRVEEAR